jgi:hypothetical protein
MWNDKPNGYPIPARNPTGTGTSMNFYPWVWVWVRISTRSLFAGRWIIALPDLNPICCHPYTRPWRPARGSSRGDVPGRCLSGSSVAWQGGGSGVWLWRSAASGAIEELSLLGAEALWAPMTAQHGMEGGAAASSRGQRRSVGKHPNPDRLIGSRRNGAAGRERTPVRCRFVVQR